MSALDRVLTELATSDACRAYNGVWTGGLVERCEGAPEVVTLGCEHEHFYDVALCTEHQQKVPNRELSCPICYAGLGVRHRCRHNVATQGAVTT